MVVGTRWGSLLKKTKTGPIHLPALRGLSFDVCVCLLIDSPHVQPWAQSKLSLSHPHPGFTEGNFQRKGRGGVKGRGAVGRTLALGIEAQPPSTHGQPLSGTMNK